MIESIKSLLCFLLLLVVCTSVAHASMQVWPTRVYFEVGEEMQTLTVRNSGDKQLVIQASPRDWSAGEGGSDQYKETDDLLVFPRMVTVEPGADQTLRFAYRGSPVSKQRAFRVLVEELPLEESGEMAMRFTVTLSIPVFVNPSETVHNISIDELILEEGALNLSVVNAGTVHEQVREISYTLFGADGAIQAEGSANGWYVLPGHKRTFRVPVSEEACFKSSQISLAVAYGKDDQTPLAGDVAILDHSDCGPSPELKTRQSNPAASE